MSTLTSVPPELFTLLSKFLLNDCKAIFALQSTCKIIYSHLSDYQRLFQIHFVAEYPAIEKELKLQQSSNKLVPASTSYKHLTSNEHFQVLLWKKKFYSFYLMKDYSAERYKLLYHGQGGQAGLRAKQIQEHFAQWEAVQQTPTELKFVMLGTGSVGKSALTINYIQGNFVDMYDPTIEDSYRRRHLVDGVKYIVDVLDTAGPEEYSAMRDQYMRTGQGFIIAFSITDPSSLEDTVSIVEQLLRSKDVEDDDDVAIVFVGTKKDLVQERVCGKEDLYQLLKDAKLRLTMHYVETSAKFAENVDLAFEQLIRLTVNSNCYKGTQSVASAKQNKRKPKAGCVVH